ncbi:MAG: Hsp20/alpha crystallin family protein [Bacteroidota bacterium]
MVDNFFKDDFMPRWGEFPVFRREMTVPAVNISETETAFSVEVAAPGMKKNDFNIEVENGLLVISAETSESSEEKDDNYTRKEFSFSSFSRSFWLPEDVKEGDIKAKYDNGVLNITVPKTKASTKKAAKTIKIS